MRNSCANVRNGSGRGKQTKTRLPISPHLNQNSTVRSQKRTLQDLIWHILMRRTWCWYCLKVRTPAQIKVYRPAAVYTMCNEHPFSKTHQDRPWRTAEPEPGHAERQHWRRRVNGEHIRAQRADDDSINPRLRRQLSAQVELWRTFEASCESP